MAAAWASTNAEKALLWAKNANIVTSAREKALMIMTTTQKYATATASYAFPAGQYVAAGASSVLSGALGVDSTAALGLWTALGSVGFALLAIAAIIADDALGLPIVDGVMAAVADTTNWLLGPFGGRCHEHWFRRCFAADVAHSPPAARVP